MASESTDDEWTPLGIAVELAAKHTGSIGEAKELLIERAFLGEVAAIASRAVGRFDTCSQDEQEWEIPETVWLRIGEQSDARWKRGDLIAAPDPNDRYIELYKDDGTLRLRGVRVATEDIVRLVASLPPIASALQKGGNQVVVPPDPIASTPPHDEPWVTLSHALTWIAFGISMGSVQLHEVLSGDSYGEHDPHEALATALEELLASAGSEQIAMRGRYRLSRDDGDAELLTDAIAPIKFEDYRQFSYLEDELRYDRGLLLWHEADEQIFNDAFEAGRTDSYRHVTVNRADLLRQFPPEEPALTERELFRCGGTFSRDDPAAIAPWWSVNQALAWIACRIPSYVEHVREMETKLYQRHPHLMTHATVEHDMGRCDEALAFINTRRAQWPNGKVLGHAGRALLEQIHSGAVQPAISENGKGRPMTWHEFAGLGLSETGGDWLDLVPQPQFLSADIMRAFPASAIEPAGAGGGIVPANRQLDHAEIIAKAAAMRSKQPSLSKGSAAASIVEELPRNPKTGKRRDYRHIERMIGHLWEGEVPESPV